MTCNSCDNLTKLKSNACVESCPPLTYEITATGACNDNPQNCAVAEDDTGRCTLAADGYYLDYNSIPVPCASEVPNCTLCSADSEAVTCLNCGSGKKLYENDCVDFCPALTYEKTDPNSCFNNPENCAIAENETGTCTTAVDGYYLDLDSQPTPCSPEVQDCDRCSSSLEGLTCSSCIPSKKLHENACINSCPALTYEITTTEICLDNPANCKVAANDSGICTTPADGYYLDSANEPIQCSTSVGDCSACSLVSNTVTCSSCGNGTKLFQNTCQSLCPASTYEITSSNSCEENPGNCATAEINSGVCLEAVPGFYLSSTNEIIKCSTTIANCDLCSNKSSGVECSKCLASNYLYSNACHSPCPTGTYQHFSEQICALNPTNC